MKFLEGILLLIPKGSSGCICSYPIKAGMAFRPSPVVKSGEGWKCFVQVS